MGCENKDGVNILQRKSNARPLLIYEPIPPTHSNIHYSVAVTVHGHGIGRDLLY